MELQYRIDGEQQWVIVVDSSGVAIYAHALKPVHAVHGDLCWEKFGHLNDHLDDELWLNGERVAEDPDRYGDWIATRRRYSFTVYDQDRWEQEVQNRFVVQYDWTLEDAVGESLTGKVGCPTPESEEGINEFLDLIQQLGSVVRV